MPESMLNYLAPMDERPYYYTYSPPEGTRWRNTTGDRRTLPIGDARERPEASLDREGFMLARIESAASDLTDEAQIRGTYFPELESLVARETGAEKVVAFDYNLRSEDMVESGKALAQNPVRFVHNDYTLRSGPQRVRDLLPSAEAERRLGARHAVINVWKPLRAPVLQAPLTFCDAQTMAQDDFIETDLRYPGRTGEIYSVRWRAEHRWYYYPQMQPDEALLLKCYDSDPAHARFTAHSAFDDPASPADAPVRESIEVRTLAFFPAPA